MEDSSFDVTTLSEVDEKILDTLASSYPMLYIKCVVKALCLLMSAKDKDLCKTFSGSFNSDFGGVEIVDHYARNSNIHPEKMIKVRKEIYFMLSKTLNELES